MKLTTLLNDYYSPMRGISDRTLRLYGFTLAAFAEFLDHEPTVDDLEPLVVARFLSWRLRNREPGTAAKDRAQLRALWQLAWDEAIPGVKRGPSASLRRIVVPERVPEAWLTDEMRRLVAAAGEERGLVDGVDAAGYWRALLLVTYDSAERISAVLSLRFADVHDGLVHFRAEGRKGHRRDITRSIKPETQEAIAAISSPPRDIVFPWERAVSTLYHHLERILKRAGLPIDRRSKFHRIRRTSASYYEAAGGDAQVLLDHSSPVLKRRSYIDPRITGAGADAASRIPRVG
jgi:site-specific recombinase XerD